MILEAGNNILVAHRRLFQEDIPRFFVGVINDYEQGVARVTGYVWAKDARLGGMHRKDDKRTKIISIASGTLLVYQLPVEANPDELQIEHDHNQGIFLTDGKQFRMDLTERL